MVTQKHCDKILERFVKLEKESLSTIKSIVDERGGRVTFDHENGKAPSIESMSFQEDIADCYVKSLYMEGGVLYADLHACYLGEGMDGVDLENDESVHWGSLLTDMLPYLEFPHYYAVDVDTLDGGIRNKYRIIVGVKEDLDDNVKKGDTFNLVAACHNAKLFKHGFDVYHCTVSVADEKDLKKCKAITDITPYM